MATARQRFAPIAQGSATPVNAQFVDNGVIVWKDLARAYEMVDETVAGTTDSDHDSDTTYIRFAIGDAVGTSWTFKIPPVAFPAGLISIDKLLVRAAVSRLALGGGAEAGIAVGYDGTVQNVGNPSYIGFNNPIYIEVNHSMTSNSVAGRAWQAADFENQLVEIGYYKAAGPSRSICTSIFCEIYYTVSDFVSSGPAPDTTWSEITSLAQVWQTSSAPDTTWSTPTEATDTWQTSSAPPTTWTPQEPAAS